LIPRFDGGILLLKGKETGTSKVTLAVPRDRAGTFDPKRIAKYQRRFPDFDDFRVRAVHGAKLRIQPRVFHSIL